MKKGYLNMVHTETRKEKFTTFDPIFCDLTIDRKSEPPTTGLVKTMSEMFHLLNILMLDTKVPKFWEKSEIP